MYSYIIELRRKLWVPVHMMFGWDGDSEFKEHCEKIKMSIYVDRQIYSTRDAFKFRLDVKRAKTAAHIFNQQGFKTNKLVRPLV